MEFLWFSYSSYIITTQQTPNTYEMVIGSFQTVQTWEETFKQVKLAYLFWGIGFHTTAHEKSLTIFILLTVSQKFSWLVVSSTMVVHTFFASSNQGKFKSKKYCTNQNQISRILQLSHKLITYAGNRQREGRVTSSGAKSLFQKIVNTEFSLLVA